MMVEWLLSTEITRAEGGAPTGREAIAPATSSLLEGIGGISDL